MTTPEFSENLLLCDSDEGSGCCRVRQALTVLPPFLRLESRFLLWQAAMVSPPDIHYGICCCGVAGMAIPVCLSRCGISHPPFNRGTSQFSIPVHEPAPPSMATLNAELCSTILHHITINRDP